MKTIKLLFLHNPDFCISLSLNHCGKFIREICFSFNLRTESVTPTADCAVVSTLARPLSLIAASVV